MFNSIDSIITDSLAKDIPTVYNQNAAFIHTSSIPNLTKPINEIKILVAEDDPTNRLVAAGYLAKMGFNVELATNGKEALKKTEKDNFDLILMDCQMPEMDGYQVTREIRMREKSYRHTPIIALTADAITGDAEKCFASGMDAYLSKPVKMKVLKEVILQTLSQTNSK
jgi:CheY-like chemotaxis protein